jgi:peroxiredoxin
LAEHAARFAELRALGLAAAALSVDTPERSRAVAVELGLPFPLLCDPERRVVAAYGVFNRGEKGGIAYPATFVLDRERRVRFRSLDRVASRADLGGLFAFLRGGLEGPAPATPERSSIVPTLGDLGRIARSALRFGIRSPDK